MVSNFHPEKFSQHGKFEKKKIVIIDWYLGGYAEWEPPKSIAMKYTKSLAS